MAGADYHGSVVFGCCGVLRSGHFCELRIESGDIQAFRSGDLVNRSAECEHLLEVMLGG